MPNRLTPRNPSSPNNKIGKKPTKKIGNSGSNSNVSEFRDRIGRLDRFNKRRLCVNESTQQGIAANQGEIEYRALRNLHGCHAGADFGAQFVDQAEALLGLDMPE